MSYYALVIAVHPDDAETQMGGSANRGQSVPSFSKVSTVTASFQDAELGVAHTAGVGSTAHPLHRFQVTDVAVDILADSLDRHPLAVGCMAS